MSNNKLSLVLKGLIKENPTFVLILGMCPTLGTTTSAINGLGMGVATMAVLIMSKSRIVFAPTSRMSSISSSIWP